MKICENFDCDNLVAHFSFDLGTKFKDPTISTIPPKSKIPEWPDLAGDRLIVLNKKYLN